MPTVPAESLHDAVQAVLDHVPAATDRTDRVGDDPARVRRHPRTRLRAEPELPVDRFPATHPRPPHPPPASSWSQKNAVSAIAAPSPSLGAPSRSEERREGKEVR